MTEDPSWATQLATQHMADAANITPASADTTEATLRHELAVRRFDERYAKLSGREELDAYRKAYASYRTGAAHGSVRVRSPSRPRVQSALQHH